MYRALSFPFFPLFPGLFYPLSYFPQGGNDLAPSPVGEGWDGGNTNDFNKQQ
jgi:hypothetical protein